MIALRTSGAACVEHVELVFKPVRITLWLTIIRINFNVGCMIVCICKAVSDKHIRRLVSEGASSLRHVSRELGVGTCCGKCVPQAREVLSDALASRTMKLSELAPIAMNRAIA